MVQDGTLGALNRLYAFWFVEGVLEYELMDTIAVSYSAGAAGNDTLINDNVHFHT